LKHDCLGFIRKVREDGGYSEEGEWERWGRQWAKNRFVQLRASISSSSLTHWFSLLLAWEDLAFGGGDSLVDGCEDEAGTPVARLTRRRQSVIIS